MIKTLIAGVAIGYFGKKLYDEGMLDSILDSTKSKLQENFPPNACAGTNSTPVASNASRQLD